MIGCFFLMMDETLHYCIFLEMCMQAISVVSFLQNSSSKSLSFCKPLEWVIQGYKPYWHFCKDQVHITCLWPDFQISKWRVCWGALQANQWLQFQTLFQHGSVTPLDVFKETLSQCLRGDKSRYFSAETWSLLNPNQVFCVCLKTSNMMLHLFWRLD